MPPALRSVCDASQPRCRLPDGRRNLVAKLLRCPSRRHTRAQVSSVLKATRCLHSKLQRRQSKALSISSLSDESSVTMKAVATEACRAVGRVKSCGKFLASTIRGSMRGERLTTLAKRPIRDYCGGDRRVSCFLR
ncbi:hypothetical protein PHYPSEUDO_006468 [Phytophthora pseudosyringae]|uniref:Uncharacterized protein n=1 Tax=Phytophthora pseudosyringae TaxID=221518 RepID=A0A8T1VIR3_9STRA|nr:hypothetical protein PHYPSEUDO_006468 [Phytophthora pseudosyringae]